VGVFSLRQSGTLSSFLFFVLSLAERQNEKQAGSAMLPRAKRRLNTRPWKTYRFERTCERPKLLVRSTDGKAMDAEQLIEEISHHESLLKIQRRNLRALELQIAQHGPFDVPLHMQGAQDDLRAEVVRLDRALRDLRARLRRQKPKR
jgi:hypothetical protein